MKVRRHHRDNVNTIHNLCPCCLSRLKKTDLGFECTGDRLEYWRNEVREYKAMSPADQAEYLGTLDDLDKFADRLKAGDDLQCDYNTNIVMPIAPSYVMIPDTLVVGRLEKKLKRDLTERELEQGYEFNIEGKTFTLPFVRFPDDC